MKLSHQIRHIWHEAFYGLAPKGGVDFAMKCKDVTEKIDLAEWPTGRWGRFRFWLHISLCQACKDYLELSQALRKAIREYAHLTQSKPRLDHLNQSLFQKYLKK